VPDEAHVLPPEAVVLRILLSAGELPAWRAGAEGVELVEVQFPLQRGS